MCPARPTPPRSRHPTDGPLAHGADRTQETRKRGQKRPKPATMRRPRVRLSDRPAPGLTAGTGEQRWNTARPRSGLSAHCHHYLTAVGRREKRAMRAETCAIWGRNRAGARGGRPLPGDLGEAAAAHRAGRGEMFHVEHPPEAADEREGPGPDRQIGSTTADPEGSANRKHRCRFRATQEIGSGGAASERPRSDKPCKRCCRFRARHESEAPLPICWPRADPAPGAMLSRPVGTGNVQAPPRAAKACSAPHMLSRPPDVVASSCPPAGRESMAPRPRRVAGAESSKARSELAGAGTLHRDFLRHPRPPAAPLGRPIIARAAGPVVVSTAGGP